MFFPGYIFKRGYHPGKVLIFLKKNSKAVKMKLKPITGLGDSIFGGMVYVTSEDERSLQV